MITKQLHEMSPEEVCRALPRLTLNEARAWIEHAQKTAAKTTQEGRCTHCGVKGHSNGSCKLKQQGDMVLEKERKRREARAAQSNGNVSQPQTRVIAGRKYLMRDTRPTPELIGLYSAFRKKYRSSMSIHEWLVYRGKVYKEVK